MQKILQKLLLIICLIVGVLEMNPLLLGIGVVGVITLFIGFFAGSKKRRAERQRCLELTIGLNQHLEQYHVLQISEHVSLRREGVLDDFKDAKLFYDDELVGSVKDFMKTPSFEDTYHRLEKKIKDISLMGNMIDENHNGVDDRLEESQRANYYAMQIKRYIPTFSNPSISAGLTEVVELLGQIEKLEAKYPQISPKLRKLYQHYLPLLVNILEQYQTLKDKQASTSEVMVMETKLEKAILLVNEALKTLIANFISDDLLNMSSDISVLEAILKRDGLVQEGTLGGMNRG